MAPSADENPGGHVPGAAANGWLVVILVVLVAVLMFRTVTDTISNRPNYTPRTVTARGELGADEKSTIEVFEMASPSVVYIRTKGAQPVFFGGTAEQQLASGSGFIWDEQGHVITNLHVVRDAVERSQIQLEVQFSDSTVRDAVFVGAVYQHDIAVLRIEAKPSQLVPITLGTSDDLKVGQKVLAIGSPFGFDQTLSTGVIGGLNRSVATEESNNEFLDGLIQTDAAINPGNSGGPLLDSTGRLIGVNTAIVSTSGASAGLGFAVPVQNVLESVTRVLERASQKQAAELGIGILDRESAQTLGIPDEMYNSGPIIRNVYRNTAAAEAGLQGTQLQRYRIILGDQIVAIDGRPVKTAEDLQKIIAEHAPGDVLQLQIIRGTQSGTVAVTLKAPKLLL